MGVADREGLLAHPKCGASREGFLIGEIIRRTGAAREETFFWGVHTGPELDLLIVRNHQRTGFESKLTRSPKVTPSMRAALALRVPDQIIEDFPALVLSKSHKNRVFALSKTEKVARPPLLL